MQRKILAICAALVALGALTIAPAMASAATLKDTTGGVTTTVAVGSKIKAISEGTSIFTAGSLSVKCNENFMTGEVVKNNGTNIEGTITDARFQGPESETKCESSLGAVKVTIPALKNEGGTGHWCLKNVPGEDRVEVFGRSCTEAGNGVLTFILDAPLGVTCRYQRKASVVASYTTDNGSHEATTLSLLNSPEFELHQSTFGCPSGNGKITEMKFRLYTDTATEAETNVWDDAASTSDPVFVTNP